MLRARVAATIAAKELRETLRDRRTLAVMVLLPVIIYPLVGIFLAEFAASQDRGFRRRSARVALAAAPGSRLGAALRGRGDLVVAEAADPKALVAARRADVGVAVPRGGDPGLRGPTATEVELYFDSARDESALARDRVEEVLARLGDELRAERVRAAGLPEALLRPVVPRRHDLAAGERLGGAILARVLPILLVLTSVLGAFYPAIDLTAGEKERGTLEALLSLPVSRLEVVTGKFVAVAALALLTGVLNLGSASATILHAIGMSPVGEAVRLPWRSALLAVVALVPTVLFFSAVLLAIAALARSFKEAQNLLTPVYLGCVLPTFVATMPGVRLGWGAALAPGLGGALLLRGLVAGELRLGPALLTVAASFVYAALALRAAAHIYDSERLLFGADPPVTTLRVAARAALGRLRAGARDGEARRALEPAEALALLGLVVGLLFFFGAPWQQRALVPGLAASQLLLIAGPSLLALRLAGVPLGAGLALRRPSLRSLAGALLVGASAWYLVLAAQQRLLPPSEAQADLARRLLTGRSIWLTLGAVALLPALCEEALFRGALLGALAPRMSRRGAVLACGLLFGLFHLSAERLPSTALLGVVASWLVLESRSLFPAVLFHLTNNGIAVGLVALGVAGGRADPAPHPALLALAAAASATGLWLARRPRSSGAPP